MSNLDHQNWVPAHGGTEKPFETRTGHLVQYLFCPATKEHQYIDVRNDMFIANDSDVLRSYGLLDPAPNADAHFHNLVINLTKEQAKQWLKTDDRYKHNWICGNILWPTGASTCHGNVELIKARFVMMLTA